MNKPGREVYRRSGLVKRSIRIDRTVYQQVAEIARRRNSTVQAELEAALTRIVAEETVKEVDVTLAPLLDRTLLERHRRLEAGLRTMMARVAYELLRSQYVWFNFMSEAGVQPSKVSRWHEEGWGFAVKEFKRQGGDARFQDDDDDEDP